MRIFITILTIVLISAALIFTAGKFKEVKEAPRGEIMVNTGELASKEAIEHFSGGLKFKTISRSDYKSADFDEFESFVGYLEKNYPLVYEKTEFKRINDYALLFKLRGSEGKEKPVILIAHYDVVPEGKAEDWQHPPFSGHFDGEYFWGRGAIDNKASLFATMEALNSLLESGFVPKRDIYIAFSHDEETGGREGAENVVAYLSEQGVHFDHVLDEGGHITQENIAFVGTGEKGRLLTKITISAKGGHASVPGENSAVEQVAKLITAFQKNPMGSSFASRKNAEHYAKTHTTLAVTMIEGSNAPNVIPKEASFTVDSRILPSQSTDDVKKHIQKIIDKTFTPSGRENVRVEYLAAVEPSKISDINSQSFKNLKAKIEKFYPNVEVEPFLSLGATDARTYGQIADNAYRFLPAMMSDEEHNLMHADNERISLKNYSAMINFYKDYIESL